MSAAARCAVRASLSPRPARSSGSSVADFDVSVSVGKLRDRHASSQGINEIRSFAREAVLGGSMRRMTTLVAALTRALRGALRAGRSADVHFCTQCLIALESIAEECFPFGGSLGIPVRAAPLRMRVLVAPMACVAAETLALASGAPAVVTPVCVDVFVALVGPCCRCVASSSPLRPGLRQCIGSSHARSLDARVGSETCHVAGSGIRSIGNFAAGDSFGLTTAPCEHSLLPLVKPLCEALCDTARSVAAAQCLASVVRAVRGFKCECGGEVHLPAGMMDLVAARLLVPFPAARRALFDCGAALVEAGALTFLTGAARGGASSGVGGVSTVLGLAVDAMSATADGGVDWTAQVGACTFVRTLVQHLRSDGGNNAWLARPLLDELAAAVLPLKSARFPPLRAAATEALVALSDASSAVNLEFGGLLLLRHAHLPRCCASATRLAAEMHSCGELAASKGPSVADVSIGVGLANMHCDGSAQHVAPQESKSWARSSQLSDAELGMHMGCSLTHATHTMSDGDLAREGAREQACGSDVLAIKTLCPIDAEHATVGSASGLSALSGPLAAICVSSASCPSAAVPGSRSCESLLPASISASSGLGTRAHDACVSGAQSLLSERAAVAVCCDARLGWLSQAACSPQRSARDCLCASACGGRRDLPWVLARLVALRRGREVPLPMRSDELEAASPPLPLRRGEGVGERGCSMTRLEARVCADAMEDTDVERIASGLLQLARRTASSWAPSWKDAFWKELELPSWSAKCRLGVLDALHVRAAAPTEDGVWAWEVWKILSSGRRPAERELLQEGASA